MTTLEQKQARPEQKVRPAYTVREEQDDFVVQVTVPGVSKQGVEIHLEGEELNIRASRTHRTPESWRPLRREIREADYELNLRLNVEVDADKISARVEDGILNITLPKAEAIKPRTITID